MIHLPIVVTTYQTTMIMGDTDLDHAYENCAAGSERLGGIAVETSFNGVEMLYHRQPIASWQEEYHRSVYGKTKKIEVR